MHKIARMSDYAPVIMNLITTTNQIGGKLQKYFTPLKKALVDKDLSKVDLSKTKRVFQSGTDKYQKLSQKLNRARIPVKVMGPSKLLQSAYPRYVKSCQAMTDSLDPDKQKVDVKKFKQSEKDQDHNVSQVVGWIHRIMA
ncbi:MAG: hypothetical protein AJITA_00130 [Acetilactobacillus jinshanensis]